MTAPHIVVLGAGSIGCYLGGLLAAAGGRVTFIGRARYQAQLREHGLTLTHFARETVHVPADSIDFTINPQALAGADIIALCTKSQDTEAAAELIAAHAKADVQVVSFQNGVRNADVLHRILPEACIVPAIVPFNVTPTTPGAFHCGTAGALVLGATVPALEQGFAAAGQDVRVSGNITGDQWAKMIVNLNNGLNTLSGGTLLEGLHERDYRRALAASVDEAVKIAEAAGVEVGHFNGKSPGMLMKTLRLPDWAYRRLMGRIVKIDATARSSMLDDLEAGRACEIDYLQGEIVRQAEAQGRAAPVNAAIMAAVEAAFAQKKSPRLSGTDILSLLNK